MSFMQKGEVGVAVQALVTESDEVTVVDVSDAIVQSLYFQSPSGTTFAVASTWTDSSGADGIFQWVTALDSDGLPMINEAGKWSVQAQWTATGGKSRKSTVAILDVYENLE
jgi:hypothetical protein